SALVALVAGWLVYEAWQSLAPAAALGARIGGVAQQIATPDVLLPLRTAGAVLERHGLALVTAAMLLAVIGALESMLNQRGVDDTMRWRNDPNHELIAMGAANAVSGLFG